MVGYNPEDIVRILSHLGTYGDKFTTLASDLEQATQEDILEVLNEVQEALEDIMRDNEEVKQLLEDMLP